MANFRKRPLEITAEQYFNVPHGWPEGVCTCDAFTVGGHGPHVHTAHQGQIVELENGDWIVPEGDGEHYYPIKDEIFRATYEPIEDHSNATES